MTEKDLKAAYGLSEDRFFHGTEADTFSFYQLPKILFSDRYYQEMSLEAKVIYSQMLDRMSLSIRNEWCDDAGRVFILFTIQNVMSLLNCATQKAVKIMKEMEEHRLTVRQRVGQGSPDRIFVLKLVTHESVPESYREKTEELHSTDPEFRKSKVLSCENRNSRDAKIATLDLRKSKASKTKENDTEKTDTDLSIPSPLPLAEGEGEREEDRLEKFLKDNVMYDFYVEFNHSVVKMFEAGDLTFEQVNKRIYSIQTIDAMIRAMTDVCRMDDKASVNVKGFDYPVAVVKSRFLKLDRFQFEDAYRRIVKSDIKSNPKNFMISVLYNT